MRGRAVYQRRRRQPESEYIKDDGFATAQSFYPNMRFGLATALMQDGYSVYDFGDTSTPVNWWYDEYDFNLGYPLGVAKRIGAQGPATPNLIANPSFESAAITPWTTVLAGGGKATFAIDPSAAAEGNSSVRMTVTATATNSWLVSIEQGKLPIVKGITYQIQFWARSDSPRNMTINLRAAGLPELRPLHLRYARPELELLHRRGYGLRHRQ